MAIHSLAASLGAAEARQRALVRRTVARECTDDEFEHFMHIAGRLGLDPLRRQIYAFIQFRHDPVRRRLVAFTGIDGFRAIAARGGDYLPDEREPSFKVDRQLVSPTNPAGLVKATVRVHKFAHGSWHKITSSAYWEEYAPVRHERVCDDAGSRRVSAGRALLDEGNWRKMPRLMLAKVAEALALRKGWPEAFAGLYALEELDRGRIESEDAPSGGLTLPASDGEPRAGSSDTVLIEWDAEAGFEAVGLEHAGGRILGFVDEFRHMPERLSAWQERNRYGLREFWARSPAEALRVKEVLESAIRGDGRPSGPPAGRPSETMAEEAG
jgi:phage recombination protein Bet